jgi:hypothetical protein
VQKGMRDRLTKVSAVTDVAGGGIFAVLEDDESVIIPQVEMIYESGHSTGRIRCTPRILFIGRSSSRSAKTRGVIGCVAQRITRYLREART